MKFPVLFDGIFLPLLKNRQSSLSNVGKLRAKAKQELLQKLNPIIKKYMSDNKIRIVLDREAVLLGDINGDTFINVQDVVLVVNLVLSAGYDSSADMNSDGITNVLDVVQIVNMILS